MAVLVGLQGVKAKEVEAVFITKSSQVRNILLAGKAATTAGDKGAINVWKDDDSKVRCEAQQFCLSVSSKIFDNVKLAKPWVDEWLQKIK